MKILALIPARGGSKRLPNKNILSLGGKPLINWTIAAARGIPEIVDILVSTDSSEIAKIAKEAGVLVPWLRPSELAADASTSIDVCLHALDWYEKERGPIDGLILLQPTSPFRSKNSVLQVISLYGKFPESSIVSLSPAESHPMWCYRVQGFRLKPFMADGTAVTRSQELPPAYVLNGSLYIASPKFLRTNKSFIDQNTIPFIMRDYREVLDIDTEVDWKLAETYIAKEQGLLT